MLHYELRKILLRRGGWFLALGLLVTQGVLLYFTQPYDRELENNRAAYEQYLQQVSGELTDEKRCFLETEMIRLEQNRVNMESLKNDYFNGNVSEAEFRESFEEYAPGEEAYTGFTKLYAQYIFVREDPDRYFLYTGGWEVLLTNWKPDILFLLVLVLLLTPVFCEEYASGMDQMLLTQKRSAKLAVPAKIATAVLVTGTLTAILQLCALIYVDLFFGLPHGDYSLRSLMTFGSLSVDLNLWQAFWLQFGVKELGYIYMAVLILLLSVLLKRVSITLIAGIVLIPLPHLAMQKIESFITLPGPWSLAVGSIYLQNDVFLAILPQIVMQAIGIIVGMIWIISCKNTNHQVQKVHWKRLLFLTVPTLLLTGCTHKSDCQICYNSVDAQFYETERFKIEMEYGEDALDPGYTLLDKMSGKRMAFPLDVLNGQSISCGWNVYGEGNCIYYIKTTTIYEEPLTNGRATSFDTLVELDMNTMQEQVLYQWNQETRWFFGLLDRPAWEPGQVRLLFLHDGDMYYAENEAICRMDLATGAWEVFSDDRGSVDIAYDGEYFYYLDQYNCLNRKSLDTEMNHILEDIVTDRFLLTPDGIYFLNKQDGNALYLWNEDTATPCKICEETAMYMQWRNGALLLTSWDGRIFTLSENNGLHYGKPKA